MINTNPYLISEGELTIKGRDSKGQDIEVTADIENLKVEVEYQDDFIATNTSNIVWNNRRETTFCMKVKGQYTIKAIDPRQGVTRTARVHVDSLTPGALVEAARKAGVDTETPFISEPHYNPLTLQDEGFDITFNWEN